MALDVKASGLAGTGTPGSSDGPDGTAATVQVGEVNLADVARRLGVTEDALRQANPQIQDPGELKVGQDVRFPPVQAGQTPTAAPDRADSKAMEFSALPPAPLGDPMMKSLAMLRLNPGADVATAPLREGWSPGTGGNVLYDKQDVKGTGLPATAKQANVNVPSDVAALLAKGAKIPAVKTEFAAVQQAIAAGDYTKASATLDSLLRSSDDVENVLNDGELASTKTVQSQLQFLSKMQQAGIHPDYQPTEAQLVDYFKTLKDNPDAARQAFQDYTQSFHVHPVNVRGADFSIPYSEDKIAYGGNDNQYTVHVVHDWSQVSQRPVKDEPRFIGKQMNDCKGYGFMAEKLLGAAGFKVAHHLSVYPGPQNQGHDMVAFTHPPEKGFTVASNDGVFHGNNEKDVAKQGYEYAVGKDKVTGREHYYTGKTMAESQIQMVVKDNEL